MKKYLLALGLGAVLFFLPHRASATVCTIPNTLSNGQIVDATPVQQNFNALVQCSNNIDWQNIDSLGIFASQIIPTTPGQATFGGSVSYTFTQHVFFTASITVDSTASPPTSGFACGNTNTGCIITSNAGAGASQGFQLVVAATAMPSTKPVLGLLYGSTVEFQVDQQGDGIFQGGVAIDGNQPDGTSLIGGVNATPFWFKSEAGSSAGANFAYLDAHNNIPSVVIENSGATVIYSMDGSGNVQENALGVDNQTPAAEGIRGGTGTAAFTIGSNSASAQSAISFNDVGGNSNITRWLNSSSTRVLYVDENGGLQIGSSGQTDIEPTSASFGGTVNVPTAGANNQVCTNGGSNLIACNASTAIGLYNNSGLRSTGLIEYGNASITMNGTSGPNSGISGTASVSLPQAMSDGTYTVTMLPEGLWVMTGLQSKSAGGFTIYAGNPFQNTGSQTVQVDWMAAGH